MVIAGVVKNGEVGIDVRGLIPDGTEVFIRPTASIAVAKSDRFQLKNQRHKSERL